MKKVANYVKTKYPQIQTVIIWDDMLRNLMGAEMMPLQVTTIDWKKVYNGFLKIMVLFLGFGGPHGLGIRRRSVQIHANLQLG